MYEFVTFVDLELLDTCPEIITDGKPSYSVFNQKIPVKWSIEFEMRSWGIKDIVISVQDQTINFEIERDVDGHVEIEDIEATIKNVNIEVTPKNGFYLSSIYPQSIEFFRGKWTVNF